VTGPDADVPGPAAPSERLPVTDRVVVDRPCALVVCTARAARGRSVVVGWTQDGLPAATTHLDGLSPDARQALDGYRGSGLPERRVPYTALVPVNYALTGPAVDFADTPERRAEDQVRYSVVDAAGRQREIALGERGVLGAITEARVPFQTVAHDSVTASASSAVPLYTVFSPLPAGRPDSGLAMLFQPTIEGGTNEPAFRSFVRNTVGRLLVLDESQPPGSRKGYLEVAGRLAGTPGSGGSAAVLMWLRRVGLVDFDDAWLQRLRMGRKQMEGQVVRLLRAMGVVDVDQPVMDEMLHPRPDYDIDPLETDRLVDLAEQMYLVARRTLG
jgi:hypothetical protein